MDVKCTQRNGNLVVKLNGEIDHHTADGIRSTVDREYQKSWLKNLVFDFAHVGFMDSSGIGMLIGRYKEATKAGGRVYAINIGAGIGRIFEVSGLTKIISCFNGIDEIKD